MSLIDSHVGLLLQVYTKQDSEIINRVDLQTGQSTSCFPALLQIKQPAIPVLRCHHSTLTREKKGTRRHKKRKTHGHTGDLSIRQNYPRMHLHLHLSAHAYSSQLCPCARPKPVLWCMQI